MKVGYETQMYSQYNNFFPSTINNNFGKVDVTLAGSECKILII
jgi:predicted Zn-dependent protease